MPTNTRARTILPTPSTADWDGGEFQLPNPLPVRLHGRSGEAAAAFLSERLQVAAGVQIVEVPSGAGLDFFDAPELGAEGYRLQMSDAGIAVFASDTRGAGWAVQTLLQLLPAAVHGPGPMEPADLVVPTGMVQDRPRFAWRGSHLDVARHFVPIEALLAHLEVMAMHKLNVFHLHLTDDQGWRFPVRKYPKLTEVGGWRPGTLVGHLSWELPAGADVPEHDNRPHGGAYTADELRLLAARADALGIMVVPEIDMPGHMEAAIAAYPELGACDHVQHPRTAWGISEHVLSLTPETVRFCTDVLDEVIEIFPNSPIHVGGDECPGNEWFSDPASLETMAKHGLTSAAAAQSWFLDQIFAHLSAAGRRVVAWDEVLDGDVPPGTIIMVWRNTEAVSRALAAGFEVVAAPEAYVYLDHAQHTGGEHPLAISGPTTLAQVATFHEVLAAATGSDRLLGGQFNLWTEYIRTPAVAQYFLWPRGSALAQQLWTGSSVDDDALRAHMVRLTAAGVNWCREAFA